MGRNQSFQNRTRFEENLVGVHLKMTRWKTFGRFGKWFDLDTHERGTFEG